MRFLADENCDAGIIDSLRSAGHDVIAVREHALGADDSIVVELAHRQNRVLLTEDKDFGQLVFAGGHPNPGVILFRIPLPARSWLLTNIASVVRDHADSIRGRFLVVEPGKIRLS